MLGEIPVTHVAGIGRTKQRLLAELGIHTVYDLLHHFPIRYEDRRIQPLDAYEDGEKVTVRAVVEGIASVRWVRRKSVTKVGLRIDQRFRVNGIWFNQHYLRDKLVDGRVVVVSGKLDKGHHTLVVNRTDFTGSPSDTGYGEYVPIYRSVKGLQSSHLHTFMMNALQQYADQLEELLPHVLRQKYKLISHAQAVQWMHHPDGHDTLRQAHRRLAFEEFFLFQLQLQWFRTIRDAADGTSKPVPTDALSAFENSLPYPLTQAQRRVCQSISDGLVSSSALNMLVQGDVGSGKTWVALFGAYAVFRCGQQTALMAPTEILAEQHHEEVQRRLMPLGVHSELLTGSTPAKQRALILENLNEGHIDIIVGTHALLTEDVSIPHLGLVITDEQHRFGVNQRAVLRGKGHKTDVLFLSATPIPRTLALAVYGDMEVGILDELPSGRKPIKTYRLSMSDDDRAIRLVRRELAAGRQAYVVAPLVDDSELLEDTLSATTLEHRLREQLAGFSVALLHGKMNAKDKDQVMRSFVRGDTQVLVSTTVIEVGINVPSATVMLIYNAERFGLAQLHQLRGRVGRGSQQSYCILMSDAHHEVAEQRLQTMVATNDGFAIAERDLELRGPGEFLGVRQSGLPEFSVGDLTKDFRVMQAAREEAVRLMESGDFWLLPAFARLREVIAAPRDRYLKD